MRDIDARLRRHRLSRYGPPTGPFRRGMRWGWVALGIWLFWIGFVSDHSLWRIWRLGRDNAKAERELARTRAAVSELDAQLSDPASQRELAERVLREKTGMAKPGEIVYRIRPGAQADTTRPGGR
jgi:cell division protein FtsB